MTSNLDDHLPPPTKADCQRLDTFLKAFSEMPQHFAISTQNRIDAWVIEQRLLSDSRANDRLVRASWLLVWVTALLVLATVGQVVIALINLK